jgi:hypothetical protein
MRNIEVRFMKTAWNPFLRFWWGDAKIEDPNLNGNRSDRVFFSLEFNFEPQRSTSVA